MKKTLTYWTLVGISLVASLMITGCAAAPRQAAQVASPLNDFLAFNHTCLHEWNLDPNRCEQMWYDFLYSKEKPAQAVAETPIAPVIQRNPPPIVGYHRVWDEDTSGNLYVSGYIPEGE